MNQVEGRTYRKNAVEAKGQEEQNLYQELTEEQLRKLDALILKSNNEKEIFRYAVSRKELSNPEEFEDRVANFENIFRIISYAQLICVKDIDKLTDDVYEIMKFCHNHQDKPNIITQEDIEKVEQMAVSSKNIFYMRVCGAWIKGVNIPRLQREVEDSEEPVEIYYFAKDVEGADIDKLRTAIKKTGKSMYRNWFMEQFGGKKKPWLFFKRKK